jgi:hypothetical protein
VQRSIQRIASCNSSHTTCHLHHVACPRGAHRRAQLRSAKCNVCDMRRGDCECNRRLRTAEEFEIVPPLNVTAPSSMATTPPQPLCAQPTQPRPLQSAPHPVRRHPPQSASVRTRTTAPPRVAHICLAARYRHGVEQRVARLHEEHAAAADVASLHERIAPTHDHRKARPPPSRAARAACHAMPCIASHGGALQEGGADATFKFR